MANNNKQKDKLVQNLDTQIKKIEEALESLKKSAMEIQNGDGKQPYWNGNNAQSILKTTLSQYEMDKDLLSYIQECKESIKK